HFFFQAEDGIRDLTVTGVQTCALPIWKEEELVRGDVRERGERRLEHECARRMVLRETAGDAATERPAPDHDVARREVPFRRQPRSEERRVGKEGRTRGRAGEEKQARRQ